MNQEKKKLEDELWKAVGRAEKGSSTSPQSSASDVLVAIDKFIRSWDELLLDAGHDDSGSDTGSDSVQLPVDFLLVKFSCAAETLGYGNVDLREQLLETLKSVGSSRCRQVVLDFLPATLPPAVHRDVDDGITREHSASRKQKKEVLSALKFVLDDDTSCMCQILRTLSIMTELGLMAARDGILFVVEILPKVPETDLHLVIQFLLKHIEDREDARIAVESIRVELSLLEKTDISDMAAVADLFGDFQNGDYQGSEFFLNEYVLMLEKIVKNHKTFHRANDKGMKLEHKERLSTFDFAFILLNNSSSIVGERIKTFIADGIYEDLQVLPRLGPSRLADLVGRNTLCQNRNEPAITLSSNVRDRVLASLVDFSMGLLLSPLRNSRTNDFEIMFLGTQEFILEVLVVLDESFQRMLISSMIGLTKKLLTHSSQSTQNHTGSTRSSDVIQKLQQTSLLVCSNIYKILGSVIDQQPGCILEFQDALIHLLKEDCLDFNNNESTLRNLCIVVTKLDAKYANKHTVEMQRLLTCRSLMFSPSRDFSSSAGITTRRRCVKGLIFADTLIQDRNIDDCALETIWSFVAKLLASPSSKMVHPEIGLHGLQIAQRLHREPSRSPTCKKLFQCITQVLTNSRVVRYCDDTKVGNQKADTLLLAYTKVPPFVSPDSPQRNFRKMKFCFNSFFCDEHAWMNPSYWERSCSWIFNLLDSYLAIGRTPKWIPQAWIRGQFEIPLIAVQSIAGSSREKRNVEAIQMEFAANKDFQNNTASASAGLEKHLIELIKGIKKHSTKVEVLRSVYRLAFSLLLALSLSAAVLTNTFDHFRRMLEGDSRERGQEDRKACYSLLEFQLLKIYDLKQKCRSMERIFHFVVTRNRRVARRSLKKRTRSSRGKIQFVETSVRSLLFQVYL
jgi:hypothetical protein